MIWRVVILLLIAALVFALACTPADSGDIGVLAALERPAERADLNRDFWLPLAQAHDPLWVSALGFCRGQEPTLPNCRTVLRVERARAVPGFLAHEETP